MIPGILFGIAAMLSYGVGTIFSKRPIESVGVRKVAFWRTLVSALFLLVLLPFMDFTFSTKFLFITMGIAIIGYIPMATFYRAVKTGKIGIVSPIARSQTIVTITLAVIFFNESLSLVQLGAIALVILGVVMLSINFKDFKGSHLFDKSSGVGFAIISALLWGLVYFLLKIPSVILGPLLTSFVLETGVFLTATLHIATTTKSLIVRIPFLRWHILLGGIATACGTLFFTLGVTRAPVSTIATIMSATPLISALGARIFYKEKLKIQQYISACLIVTGIALISYF